MYAVIRTGGKQYRVAPGDVLEVEKLDGNVGDSITLEDVLMVVDDEDVQIGQPTVEGATVSARITGQHRGEKILVFRYRPKKRVRVRRGHRQYLTRLQIEAINGQTGASAAVAQTDAAVAEAADEETPVETASIEAEAPVPEAEAAVEAETTVAVEAEDEQSEDVQSLDSADDTGAEEQEGDKE